MAEAHALTPFSPRALSLKSKDLHHHARRCMRKVPSCCRSHARALRTTCALQGRQKGLQKDAEPVAGQTADLNRPHVSSLLKSFSVAHLSCRRDRAALTIRSASSASASGRPAMMSLMSASTRLPATLVMASAATSAASRPKLFVLSLTCSATEKVLVSFALLEWMPFTACLHNHSCRPAHRYQRLLASWYIMPIKLIRPPEPR